MIKRNLKKNTYFGVFDSSMKLRMKAFTNPAPLLALAMLLLSQCSDDKTPVDARKGNKLPEMITEATLPPGKQVIDDIPLLPVNNTPPVIALGNKNNPGNSTKISPAKDNLDKAGYFSKTFKNLLVFHADDTMEVNKPKLATLILGRNESIDKLKLEVLDESDSNNDHIKSDTGMEFGSKMKARLVPFGGSRLDNSFEIEELGDDIQSFKAERKKILWQWKITPLKPGKHELKLSIQVIEKDGEATSLPARNIPVLIFAKPETFLSKAGDFISRKYEFLITAIMIPVLIAWFTTHLRNKAPSANVRFVENESAQKKEKEKEQPPAADKPGTES
jgi:hypothetical protein